MWQFKSGEIKMAKFRAANAGSLVSITAMVLGTTVFPQSALAQNSTTQSATTQSAATANSRGGGRHTIDPGVRGGDPGVGGALPGLNAMEQAFFKAGSDFFTEVEDVAAGLGPRFNLDSCGGCHIQPALGGSSPPTNPQMTVAGAQQAKNVPFISADGPIREARFVRNPDGTPDGGVHALFVITGRADAGTCNIKQPDFAGELARHNVIFRIPTPTFGLGLVENIPESGLVAGLAANAQQKRSLGISGRFNRSGNDGTITRFGWKAQNKSLLIFAGEAYNVEMGVTNDAFPNERETDPNCQLNPTPESTTFLTPAEDFGSPAANYSQDIINFAAFMRLLAPPTPAGSSTAPTAQAATTQTATSTTTVASADPNVASVLPSAAGTATAPTSSTASTSSTATTTRGRQVFNNVGCAACHVVKYTTGKSPFTGQTNVSIEPLSDFAVHDMGSGLADGVSQGNANGSEFRTAPLWGVGQRVFFLHDGRTNDLYEAIQQHSSRGSEANEVIRNYNLLGTDDKQALVNYLRSL
jgi:CxxC motif-containing protein (DUF1111 family)